MEAFFSNYLTLAGPAITLSWVVTAIAYVALGGRDFALPRGLFWVVVGAGIVAALVVSVVMALAGFTASTVPTVIGIVVGLVAAYVTRPRRHEDLR